MKKEETMNFIRLLDASERLIVEYDKGIHEKEAHIRNSTAKTSTINTTFVERFTVHVFNLQQKVREVIT